MVKINGKEQDMVGKTILEMLLAMEYRKETVAVEINEEIISKELFETTLLAEGDVVEVVTFMGGGSIK